ncbi:MAG: hypothetical protein ACK56I_28045, partial [bacterium]
RTTYPHRSIAGNIASDAGACFGIESEHGPGRDSNAARRSGQPSCHCGGSLRFPPCTLSYCTSSSWLAAGFPDGRYAGQASGRSVVGGRRRSSGNAGLARA